MADLQFTEKIEPQKILKLLARAIPYYLDSWQEIDAKRGLFGKTSPKRFNMTNVKASSPVIEYVLRPHINVLCVLSAYLYIGQTETIAQIISKDELVDKLKKGLAWACDTHITGDLEVHDFLERKKWGQNWKSSQWATMLGVVSVLAESVLAEREQIRIREIIAYEADRFTGVMPPSGGLGDSPAIENALDVMLLSWAINLCQHHPHLQSWENTMSLWAVNIASVVHDRADHGEYCGSSIARTVTTCNLYPDFTAKNHGFFHPEVLSWGMWMVLALAAYKFQRREAPACLKLKNHQKAFDILMRFCLPNGMLFSPGGHDMPLFIPHPLILAWGLWNGDPSAFHLTYKLLAWMDATLAENKNEPMPWVRGFDGGHDGWTLHFQSQAGMELAMLACLPFPKDQRSFTAGQVENAIDTRHIYPYVEICYRRNVRTTRSVAWKAIGGHPMIGLNIHSATELVAPFKAALLGMPSVDEPVKSSNVLFHNDKYSRDGFDTSGRIAYYGAGGKQILTRDLRIITWGDEGFVIFDKIVADVALYVNEHYLSPLYIVNDTYTNGSIGITSGALKERADFNERKYREFVCPASWVNIDEQLLYQFIWGRMKGLCYLPGGERNAPPYWKNCRLDMLAVYVEPMEAAVGDTIYNVGFYVGGGKGPRNSFKTSGAPGEFFKGLVVMDGKITLGLD